MVQQEIEAVIVGDDVEEEEAVVLQEEGCPAVIVEEVPSAQVEECYSAQVLVYDDETYLMQGVAEEQEVVTEVVETGKNVFCFHLEKHPNLCVLLLNSLIRNNNVIPCTQISSLHSNLKFLLHHYVNFLESVCCVAVCIMAMHRPLLVEMTRCGVSKYRKQEGRNRRALKAQTRKLTFENS